MEAEIIPMCEDQGMAIVPWAARGGGQLMTVEEREQKEKDPDARQGYRESEADVKVSEVLEKLAEEKNTTLQAMVRFLPVVSSRATLTKQALSYLLHQSPYVFTIVGVQTTSHVNALPAALTVKFSKEDISRIHDACPFNPLFPMNFLFGFKGDQPYHLGLTTVKYNQQYQMAAWVDAPPKQGVSL